MKRNVALVLYTLFCLFLMVGCNSSSDSTSASTSDTGLASGELFYETMKDTTPVYEPDSVEGLSAGSYVVPAEAMIDSEEWLSGNLLYSVYFTLRDFQSPRDEGVVDRSNLYKLLYDAETVLTGSYSYAEELAEPQAIASPFAGIDTSGSVFTHAANLEDDSLSVAYCDTDSSLEALITWKWLENDNPDKAERGIAYYVYDKETQDVQIDMVYAVDYDISTPETEYNLRCRATGNAADHSFQFNYIIGSTKIIAKGVSQGEDNYVIFKFTGGEETDYLKVPAGEGEAFFVDIYENDNEGIVIDPSSIEDGNGYLTWIDAEEFMTESDLLTSTEQLNVDVDGLEGTINLNY